MTDPRFCMLEILAAVGAAIGPPPRRAPARAGPIAMGTAALSIATSIAALIGAGRTSGSLSAVESLALLGTSSSSYGARRRRSVRRRPCSAPWPRC